MVAVVARRGDARQGRLYRGASVRHPPITARRFSAVRPCPDRRQTHPTPHQLTISPPHPCTPIPSPPRARIRRRPRPTRPPPPMSSSRAAASWGWRRPTGCSCARPARASSCSTRSPRRASTRRATTRACSTPASTTRPDRSRRRSAARARRRWRRSAKRTVSPFERCGKVVVATRADEIPALDRIAARAEANGVTAHRIGPERLAEIEPHARGVAALHVPEAGIVDYGAVVRALRAAVEAAGGSVVTGAAVSSLREVGRRGRGRDEPGRGAGAGRRGMRGAAIGPPRAGLSRAIRACRSCRSAASTTRSRRRPSACAAT